MNNYKDYKLIVETELKRKSIIEDVFYDIEKLDISEDEKHEYIQDFILAYDYINQKIRLFFKSRKLLNLIKYKNF